MVIEGQPLIDIEKRVILVSLIVVAGSLIFYSLPVFLGALSGSLIVILNLLWLRRIISRLLFKDGKRLYTALQLVLKVLIVFAFVTGMIYFSMKGYLNLWAFLIGLSTLFFGVLLEGLISFLRSG
uniref:ATP synthase I n=1 Tax=uncultured prokaryote TaxID=198431 RepID=H5SPA3_9ZZZZ|nr:hypothetical protein HGMM_F53F08C32 [uncultured prokaryote]